MARQTIEVGAEVNDGSGDPLRSAGVKINQNFIELYSDVVTLNNLYNSLDLDTSELFGRVAVLEDFNTNIGYIATDINKAIRKSLNPYSYTSYLPNNTPFTTPSITLNTPTKILVPTTVKSSNAWGVEDVGGGNFAVQYTGSTTETFKIYMSTGVESSANNTVLSLIAYKNGVEEPGIRISNKISSGSDVSSLTVIGECVMSPNDYIEIWINTTLDSTFTFSDLSILITEKN